MPVTYTLENHSGGRSFKDPVRGTHMYTPTVLMFPSRRSTFYIPLDEKNTPWTTAAV